MRFPALALAAVLLFAACSDDEPKEARNVPSSPLLEGLRQEPKFEPDAYYTGPDTPEEGPALVALVDSAIDDIAAMPQPRDPEEVRDRLRTLVRDLELFATEDRERAYSYAIRIRRAAGFTEESKLFAVPDDRVLAVP